MKRIVITTVVIAVAVLGIAGIAVAQSKTLTGETQTISATVEAINVSTRTLTIKGPKGNYVDIVVPADREALLDDQGRRRPDGALLRESRDPEEAAGREGRGHLR